MANINPLQIMQMMQNPRQVISKMLGKNPLSNNLINLINKKDTKGLEEMARNLGKEKNIDVDNIFDQVKGMFG